MDGEGNHGRDSRERERRRRRIPGKAPGDEEIEQRSRNVASSEKTSDRSKRSGKARPERDMTRTKSNESQKKYKVKITRKNYTQNKTK